MWGYDRGQAIQLGALFLFGFAIVGLSLFQLFAVPAQNEEVEFKHDQQIEQDMQELRTALVNARAGGGPRSVTVSIRPTYPSRFLLTNGGPAAGTLRTVETGAGEFQSTDVNFTNVCGQGSADSITANHVVHQPDYNYYSEESAHRYENTVYYRDTGSSLLNRTGQVFIRPSPSGTGGVISIYPIRDNFQQSGGSSATVQFIGGETGSESYSAPTITVPTRIDESGWRSLIKDTDNEVTISSAGTNMLEFSFDNDWTVTCRPVGIGSAPEQADTDAISGDDSSETRINPNFETGVIYRGASVRSGSDDTVDITFENRASSEREMVEARFAFYDADGQGGTGGGNTGLGSATFGGATLDYLGSYEDIGITFSGGQTKQVPISFDCEDGSDYTVGNGDYFVISVILSNGESNTYFVAPDGGKSGNTGC